MHAKRDDGRPNRFDDVPMTLLVPVLLLAILVLAWIAWLAFGSWSSPVLPSYLLHGDSQGHSNRFLAFDPQSPHRGPLLGEPLLDETEHVRTRLSASNSNASSLSGNALHLEMRPAWHDYGSASRCTSDSYPHQT